MGKAIAQSEWIDLAGGGKVRRDPQNPLWGWQICPDCEEPVERYVMLGSPGSHHFQNLTGLCHKHGSQRAARKRSPLKGKQKHASGAHFLFDDYDGIDEPNIKCWIVCPNPDGNSECLGRYQGWKYNWYREEASCLCENCLTLPGRGHRARQILKDRDLNDGPDYYKSGTKILYSLPRELYGMIAVRHWLCGHDIAFKERTLTQLLNQRKRGKYQFSPRCSRACTEIAPDVLRAMVGDGNGQKNGGAAKKQRGGAHHVKWTPALRATYLTVYKDVLLKIRNNDPSLPAEILREASLRGNKPSDIARDYAAHLVGVESSSYLERVLVVARKEARPPNIQM
jgi:hypothetical protein